MSPWSYKRGDPLRKDGQLRKKRCGKILGNQTDSEAQSTGKINDRIEKKKKEGG